MKQKIKIAGGVVWYPIDDKQWVAALPGRYKSEKCLLLGKSRVNLLERISMSREISPDTLDTREKELISKWLTPEYRLLEEVHETSPPKVHERLAFAVLEEYQSAKRLEKEHNLIPYHRDEINDPFHQFDQVETTVSHLYRDPHPALGGESYGSMFAKVLKKEGAIKENHKILEVGCGTGIFGREFLHEIKNAAANVYKSLSYTFFDVSPVLSKSQEELNKEHTNIVSFVTGDVQTHAFPKGAFDLVLANEMIADLPVVKLIKADSNGDTQDAEAWDLASRFGLDFSDAPPQFVLNTGALKFLKTVYNTLKPKGRAYITEYGSLHSYAKARTILDHVEYSIHFGHLLTASQRLGFKTTVQPLSEFLHFSGDVKVLDALTHLSIFDHLMPFLGMDGDAVKVYTEKMFSKSYPQLAQKTGNLEFVRLDSLGGIIYPAGFYALRLIKD